MLKDYADKKLPPELKDFVGQWAFYGKLLVERKVEYKWTF